MNMKLSFQVRMSAVFCVLGIFSVGPAQSRGSEPQARKILDATGIKGGLVVHVGSDNGKLTASLRASDSFTVHGLDTDPESVAEARQHIRSLGIYGPVSVDSFDGRHLPYIDGLVNLVVAEDLGDLPMTEITRVLAPLGTAYIRQDGKWTTTIKPRPDDIDEWKHYLHDASNNAVAHDDRVGPPRHLQLQCGPRWSRHHDHMSSVSALITAGGRIFYILDEGSPFSLQLPSDWKLIARDAFNGVLLWKRPIEKWQSQLWPLKSGPASLPRRLVASGERVYATLGIDAPVTALDAVSGETVHTYQDTTGGEEILLKDGVLLVLVNRTPVDWDADLAADSEQGKSRDYRTTYSPQMAKIWAGIRSRSWSNADRVVRAFDAATGRMLWEKESRIIPLTLAADSNNVYFHDGGKIVAVNLSTGEPRWTSEPVAVWQGLDGTGTQSWFAPTLVVHDGMVLFAGGEKIHMSYVGWGSKDIGQDTMSAFSAQTGKKLWTADHPYSGYNSPEDMFVTNGRVWAGNTAQGGPNGRYIGHDLSSGQEISNFPPTVDTHWFHHRCHRAKATDNYILCSRTGIEFVDLKTGEWTINHWVRGACLYGIMPAQGLIYSPPHPCACYPEAKLNGFTALAAKRKDSEISNLKSQRLLKGPAYKGISNLRSQISDPGDWPMYRRDTARSGTTSISISPELQPVWDTELRGRLTPPIVTGGRVFVADIDRHTVHAVDTGSGKKLWSYQAGGRIDSPPAYHRGCLLFGSADGYFYCLRASDGALSWRFLAAPLDRRLVAFDQIESLWPVHGSPLIQDGVATIVAGRSRFLDGGLRLCRLDVESGRLLSEKVLDEHDAQTGENLQASIKGLNMPVALPDILSSDGRFLYMRSQAMDLQGNPLTAEKAGQSRNHLFAPYGFTDTSWFHRTYWVFGDSFQGGVGGYGNGRRIPAGRILACDDKTVFGYGRKSDYWRWTSVLDYQLFAAVKSGADSSAPAKRKEKNKTTVAYRWTRDIPIMVRAMVLAGNVLLIAGPADLMDEDALFQKVTDPATKKQFAAQGAAIRGESGAFLYAIEPKTGQTLAEYRLNSLPVFDGLIAAAGRVFITTTDGRLICLGK